MEDKQPTLPPPQLNIDNLKALKILGKGAMGTVFLVHDKTTDPSAFSPFALKVVDKTSLTAKPDADRRARWEIQVLTKLSSTQTHPFLPSLIGTLETCDFLAWGVPYCPGGDLNVLRHRQNDGVFSYNVMRFYLAEVICAIEHLHNMEIVYRDLKPENILIQQSGHVTLTDFDLSRKLINTNNNNNNNNKNKNKVAFLFEVEVQKRRRRLLTRWVNAIALNGGGGEKNLLRKTKSSRVSPVSRRRPSFGERSNSFVGTDEYLAPEVVRGDGHEYAVDWWALGVLCYEMLYGTTPFKGKNRKETFRNILMKTPEFIGKLSEDLTDLIRRLLDKDPTKRLGFYRGAAEIKEHMFFKGVSWDLLTEVVRPPFIPSREDDELTENVAAVVGGVDIAEYFQNLREPPQFSLPSSPLNVSFAEY
ncbi:hypothetical protein ACFE04_007629 [Oxalis oulophora]